MTLTIKHKRCIEWEGRACLLGAAPPPLNDAERFPTPLCDAYL